MQTWSCQEPIPPQHPKLTILQCSFTSSGCSPHCSRTFRALLALATVPSLVSSSLLSVICWGLLILPASHSVLPLYCHTIGSFFEMSLPPNPLNLAHSYLSFTTHPVCRQIIVIHFALNTFFLLVIIVCSSAPPRELSLAGTQGFEWWLCPLRLAKWTWLKAALHRIDVASCTG